MKVKILYSLSSKALGWASSYKGLCLCFLNGVRSTFLSDFGFFGFLHLKSFLTSLTFLSGSECPSQLCSLGTILSIVLPLGPMGPCLESLPFTDRLPLFPNVPFQHLFFLLCALLYLQYTCYSPDTLFCNSCRFICPFPPLNVSSLKVEIMSYSVSCPEHQHSPGHTVRPE